MSNIVIIEGARTMGKSTLARLLREKIPNTTLLNPTGYIDEKSVDVYNRYYDPLVSATSYICRELPSSLVLWDRSFISEMIYSKLYKSFDTSQINYIRDLLDRLIMTKGVNVHIIHLTTLSCVALPERLNRDKVPYGAKDTTTSITDQILAYGHIFEYLQERLGNESNFHIRTYYVDLYEDATALANRVTLDLGY